MPMTLQPAMCMKTSLPMALPSPSSPVTASLPVTTSQPLPTSRPSSPVAVTTSVPVTTRVPVTTDSGAQTPYVEAVKDSIHATISLEVMVGDATCIPETSLISIRTGSSRRQQSSLAKLRTQPLKLPILL